ncbi:MarR family winged helix-turn-helix transcriptional regulator [Planomonospora parontospora]|uniref:MarR family winged helix-turn-helix transcriptional regulator n=1 Tax=Planomonospora parontospora TaxID=58119 RepID=UPI00166FD07E|nr:MarR family transcriptional regulator [Planomonospora parontospora]GGL31114.1 MarR family transcriptional regulator [Planomonospora parontospora subsp. antibiotica]GII16614.1 MarR family transcriptional regulator [Planomonospora parontospora subsp. antibiotica]
MVVHPTAENLDLSLVTLFTGWAMTDEVQRRLADDGFGDLRFNDGVVIQHLLRAPLSVTALARRMGITQQAASKAVTDMERRGLLTREPAPGDARTRLLRLTPHAAAAVEAARAHRAALDAELAERFGPDRIAETRAVLAAVLAHLDRDDAVRNRRVRPPA